MRLLALFMFALAFAEDPKIGDTREKVISLLGNPDGNLVLKDGGAMFSYPRGDVVFDKRGVIRHNLLPEAEFKRMQQEKSQPIVPKPDEVVAASKRLVASLLPKFELLPTLPGDPAMYLHKAFPVSKYGLMPRVIVSSDGQMTLVTAYYGGRWIFHDSALVSIGDKGYRTSVMGANEPARSVEGNGFIYEMCVFAADKDVAIIRDMSKSKGEKILVSVTRGHASVLSALTGQQFAVFPPIVELNAEQVKAVRESVELADAFLRLEAQK